MSYPRLSNLERQILETLINHTELYGLQLVAIIPNLKRGTVYVTLNRMEEKGFIASREFKEPGWPGLPRQLYKITGVGRQTLAAQAAAEAAHAAVMSGVAHA